LQQQTEKTQEFQSRMKDLENKHEEERQAWTKQLEDYKNQLDENTVEWESRLEEAHERYSALETKYVKETKEWQALLEMDMTKTMEECEDRGGIFRTENVALGTTPNTVQGNSELGMLSPIPRATWQSNPGTSIEDSSLNLERVPSESMERIDGLLEELGMLDAERTAMLDEINGIDDGEHKDARRAVEASITAASHQAGPRNEGSSVSSASADDFCPKPVETPEKDDESQRLDTSGDASLDQTISLLKSLKELMTNNGDVAEQEVTVLERLEELSDLMQDRSGYRSLMSSPGRVVRASGEKDPNGDEKPSQVLCEETIDSLPEKDSTWILNAKNASDPWPALVAELKSRCEFLERDRNELSRITEGMIRMERETHKVELEAAAATATREANEKLHDMQQQASRKMRNMYQTLCVHCQRRVYSAL